MQGHQAEFDIGVAEGTARVPHIVQATEELAQPLGVITRPTLRMLIKTLYRLRDRTARLDCEIAHSTAQREIYAFRWRGLKTTIKLLTSFQPRQSLVDRNGYVLCVRQRKSKFRLAEDNFVDVSSGWR